MIVLLVLLAALAALAQPARAQEVQRTPFESDLLQYRSFFHYGGFEPDLGTLLPEGYTSRWRLSAGVNGDYSDNVDKSRRARDAFSSDGSLGLGWLRQSPRLTGSADYRFSSPLYQSGAIEGRDNTTHALAGALQWQAAPHLSTELGGYVTQNLERGLATPLPGVRSNYANRSDQYSGHASYSWRASRTVTNDASYAFSYRHFVSDQAQGGDTRSHTASTGLGWQMSARDDLSLSYGYSRQDELSASVERQDHTGSATWAHTFLTFPENRRSTLSVTYTGDRGLEEDGVDYWNHAGQVGYSLALSPRTRAGARVGYQWIQPSEGSTEQGVTYGGDVDHQFSEHTSGNLSFSESWDYQPATSTSDFTQLTKTRRLTGSLSSQLGRHLTGRLDGGYLNASVDQRFGLSGGGDYWEGHGRASLSGGVGADGFWGLGYSVYRRQTEESDEDYLLQALDLYYRHQLWKWLSATVDYGHERRNYDVGSTLDSYHENHVIFGLTASI